METHSIKATPIGYLAGHRRAPSPREQSAPRRKARRLLRAIHAALIGAVTVTSLMVLALWAASTGAITALSAVVAMAGLVFLGLAVDARGVRAVVLAVTGAALPLLGLAGLYAGPEWPVMGAALLNGWLAATLFERLFAEN